MENFEWTQEHEDNFKGLKRQFATCGVRAAPIYKGGEDFMLTIDFSGVALGAILSQVQGGKERLIAAARRRTTSGEANYPSWKGEMAAMVYGIRKWEHILSYKPFVVRTDSSVLLSRAKIKPITGIIARWTEYLSGFEFRTQHIAGRKNVVADGISRTPEHLDDPTVEEQEESSHYAIHRIGEAQVAKFGLNATKLAGKDC